MASQYPCTDPTMHISKDVLPQFKFLKRACGKEFKSDVLKWVFAMHAPHIQAILTTNSSTFSTATFDKGVQTVIDLSQDLEVLAFFQSLDKIFLSPLSSIFLSIMMFTFNTSSSSLKKITYQLNDICIY
jgi:hypothetical protein